MVMTRHQIKMAIRVHVRRMRQLKRWYDESHPLYQFHTQQVSRLREQLLLFTVAI